MKHKFKAKPIVILNLRGKMMKKVVYVVVVLLILLGLSMLLKNNETFNKNHSNFPTRCIDWKRGRPYVWKEDDFDYLINSQSLFARKFDVNIDKEIVDKIFGFIQTKSENE